MSFRATQETLEALDWPNLLARLQAACRTGQGARRLEQAAIAFRATAEVCDDAENDAIENGEGHLDAHAEAVRLRLGDAVGTGSVR